MEIFEKPQGFRKGFGCFFLVLNFMMIISLIGVSLMIVFIEEVKLNELPVIFSSPTIFSSFGSYISVLQNSIAWSENTVGFSVMNLMFISAYLHITLIWSYLHNGQKLMGIFGQDISDEEAFTKYANEKFLFIIALEVCMLACPLDIENICDGIVWTGLLWYVLYPVLNIKEM